MTDNETIDQKMNNMAKDGWRLVSMRHDSGGIYATMERKSATTPKQ